MTLTEFQIEIKKLGIILTDLQYAQLEKYYELLVEYNKRMNLTGIVKKEEVYLKHFYDSITLIKQIDLTKNIRLCDIGTGAGFPGLVLKIIFPNLDIVLLDALKKRVHFLQCVIDTLKLKKIEVIHARAEEYAINHRNQFDLTTARAVAHLSILLEYSIPMTKINGYFISLKGNVEEEIKEIDQALKRLHVRLINIDTFQLPFENSHRSLVKFQKIKDNQDYPRKYSDMKKNRL